MKRLIYGVSVVALVLAASFSFVSCNDYAQDQLTEINSKLGNPTTTVEQLEETLNDVISEYGQKIQDLQNGLSHLKDSLSDLEDDLYDYEDYVDLTYARIDSLEKTKNNLEQLKNKVDDLEEKMNLGSDSVKVALDSLFTLYKQVEVAGAMINRDPSGNLIVKEELSNAIYQANEEKIAALADSIALAKADSLDNVLAAKIKKQWAHADSVHKAVLHIADSVHAIVMSKIDNLEANVAVLAENYDQFQSLCREAIYLLQNQIDNLKDSYNKQITSIILQGTYNNVFGSINLPFDFQSMILAGHYGKINADGGEVVFPQPIAGITPETTMTFQNGDDLEPEASGLVYFTVNPNTVSLDDVEFSLVNSLDEEIGFKVGDPFKSDTKLSFGWTRANNGFYCAAVTPDEAYAIDDLKPRINFSDIKSVLKQAFKDFEAKKTFDLKSIARVIYENSSDILDATAIKATWTDAYGTEKSVYTNYDVAATVMKPLSFAFDGFDTYADKLAAKMNKLHISNIKDVAFDFNINIDTFSLDTLTRTVYPIKIKYDTSVKFLNSEADLSEFIKEINAYYVGQTEDQVNNLIDQIKDQAKSEVQRAIDQVNNDYVSKVNNYINKYNNYLTRIINRLENTDFNHYLQPCILICQDKHFGQVSTSIDVPTFVLGGTGIELTPTTYTAELLSPAMYKYLAVTNVYDLNKSIHPQSAAIMEACNDSDCLMNVPFQYKQQPVLKLPVENAIYEIEYQAIDWSGKVRTDKYYIRH